MLLVRICVGKIEKDDRTIAIIRGVPIWENMEGWNCVYWVNEALQLLQADEKAMGTYVLSCPCSHLLNSGESMNHCPVPASLLVMISCCCMGKPVGDSQSSIAFCCSCVCTSRIALMFVWSVGRTFRMAPTFVCRAGKVSRTA